MESASYQIQSNISHSIVYRTGCSRVHHVLKLTFVRRCTYTFLKWKCISVRHIKIVPTRVVSVSQTYNVADFRPVVQNVISIASSGQQATIFALKLSTASCNIVISMSCRFADDHLRFLTIIFVSVAIVTDGFALRFSLPRTTIVIITRANGDDPVYDSFVAHSLYLSLFLSIRSPPTHHYVYEWAKNKRARAPAKYYYYSCTGAHSPVSTYNR